VAQPDNIKYICVFFYHSIQKVVCILTHSPSDRWVKGFLQVYVENYDSQLLRDLDAFLLGLRPDGEGPTSQQISDIKSLVKPHLKNILRFLILDIRENKFLALYLDENIYIREARMLAIRKIQNYFGSR
jgi:hypothetical protein